MKTKYTTFIFKLDDIVEVGNTAIKGVKYFSRKRTELIYPYSAWKFQNIFLLQDGYLLGCCWSHGIWSLVNHEAKDCIVV